MYVVDSSVWIALFLDDDSQHQKALDAIARIGDERIQVPYGVIAETVTVLSRKDSKAQANRFVEFVRLNPQLEMTSAFSLHDMQVFTAESDRLSFVDSLLKDMALRGGYTLISFDKELLESVNRSKSLYL